MGLSESSSLYYFNLFFYQVPDVRFFLCPETTHAQCTQLFRQHAMIVRARCEHVFIHWIPGHSVAATPPLLVQEWQRNRLEMQRQSRSMCTQRLISNLIIPRKSNTSLHYLFLKQISVPLFTDFSNKERNYVGKILSAAFGLLRLDHER